MFGPLSSHHIKAALFSRSRHLDIYVELNVTTLSNFWDFFEVPTSKVVVV
jgi:hypothetical protein